MDQTERPMRKPYRLPGTIRRAIFDVRNFLRELNKLSDSVAEKQNMPRCAEAQEHYDRAKKLIGRIDEILR
jgi:hypothetical protein